MYSSFSMLIKLSWINVNQLHLKLSTPKFVSIDECVQNMCFSINLGLKWFMINKSISNFHKDHILKLQKLSTSLKPKFDAKSTCYEISEEPKCPKSTTSRLLSFQSLNAKSLPICPEVQTSLPYSKRVSPTTTINSN